VITVGGEMHAVAMGKTLHHEYLLVDFIGADSTGYHRWNCDSIVYPKFLPEHTFTETASQLAEPAF